MRNTVKINGTKATVTAEPANQSHILFSKSTPELVSDVLNEQRLKNRAYEFIAEQGLMNKFYDFNKRRF